MNKQKNTPQRFIKRWGVFYAQFLSTIAADERNFSE